MDKMKFSSHSLKLTIPRMPNLSQKLIGAGTPYEKLLLEILKLDPDGYEPFCLVETTILPFGDKIIYDGFLIRETYIGKNMEKNMLDQYKEAKSKKMIIKSIASEQ